MIFPVGFGFLLHYLSLHQLGIRASHELNIGKIRTLSLHMTAFRQLQSMNGVV